MCNTFYPCDEKPQEKRKTYINFHCRFEAKKDLLFQLPINETEKKEKIKRQYIWVEYRSLYKMSTLEAGYIPHKSTIVDILYTEILCTFFLFCFCLFMWL